VSRPRLVVIGNGMVADRLLEELLRLAPDLYDIVLFGEEPWPAYNRILLSPVLAGEQEITEILTRDDAWYAERGIDFRKGVRATRIDRARRLVHGADGSVVPYDRLVLATGSRPVVLPIPGRDLEGVVTFRDIADVERMRAAAARGGRAVVIGGGLLGLEAAAGLQRLGMEVTVVHLLDRLMEQQLDDIAARMLREDLEGRGLRFLMERRTRAILGERRVEGVAFEDGETIPADLVVMAVGIRPETTLAREAGLHCERGIVVSDTLQTYDPRIWAVGECCQHRGRCYGLVAPLFEQARVLANQLAELATLRYEGSVTATKLKVTGIDLFSAGDHLGRDGEPLVLHDPGAGVYRKLVLKDDRIIGIVLYGDTVDGSWYFQLMQDGTDVSSLRETLLFGQVRLGDSGHDPVARVAGLPDDAEICGCNGVCKGTIVRAITEKGLFTLDEVRAHTKASASCGSCTGLVEALLAHVMGGHYERPRGERPLCPCTDYDQDTIRRTIVREGLKSIPEVMHFLEWKTPDGCRVCRPALNFFLMVAWPEEYRDDPASRFVNERVHANIQKDGTYSVVPRIFGGVTTPAQLRALAEVAERYRVPTVKITGGQRIDLLGVRKEDLPHIWRDLTAAGFVSGHAYGKAVRTVKTCVGSEWCRFGVQDSTSLGIALEKLCWGAWTPAKVKMGVSGCPRNCAEATIKDFGAVAVESGWEIHVGGNGGVKVRTTELLTKVATAEEVLEYAAAFLQLYREEGRYGERTAFWIERIGLDELKRRLVEDPEGRRALAARFREAQARAQRDPWRELAERAPAEEFRALAEVPA